MADGELIDKLPPPTAKACSDCPWRRDSTKGWLGPMSAKDWIVCAHSDEPIACHQTITPDAPSWSDSRQCRGAGIFRRNVFKSSRFPDDASNLVEADRVTVFANNAEFLEHHEGSLLAEYLEAERERKAHGSDR